MASTVRFIEATPERVWAVLADGWSYAGWVVGATHIRDVDAGWPAAGTRIHHSVGAWPFTVEDTTVVQVVEPGRHLQLMARAWPAGQAVVDLRLVPEGGGTTVAMVETPVAGPAKFVHNPVLDAVLHRRNSESLSRLAALTLGHA